MWFGDGCLGVWNLGLCGRPCLFVIAYAKYPVCSLYRSFGIQDINVHSLLVVGECAVTSARYSN